LDLISKEKIEEKETFAEQNNLESRSVKSDRSDKNRSTTIISQFDDNEESVKAFQLSPNGSIHFENENEDL
jgi:hypothetical protein